MDPLDPAVGNLELLTYSRTVPHLPRPSPSYSNDTDSRDSLEGIARG